MKSSPMEEFVSTIVQWESSPDKSTLADTLMACLRRLSPMQRFHLLQTAMQACMFEESSPWGVLAERSFVSLLLLSSIDPAAEEWKSAAEFIRNSHSFFVHAGRCARCKQMLRDLRA